MGQPTVSDEVESAEWTTVPIGFYRRQFIPVMPIPASPLSAPLAAALAKARQVVLQRL